MERRKKTAGSDDVCQASFYILIMCKYDDDTIYDITAEEKQ